MRNFSASFSLAAALASPFGLACAADNPFGNATEARAMIERALVDLKANETAAIASFNKADGPYRDRDLYVFCFNATNGSYLAHVDPSRLGKDNRLTVEKDGSPIGQKLFDAVNAAPEGNIVIVNYKFPKPGTTEPLPKETLIARVGKAACGVGFYK